MEPGGRAANQLNWQDVLLTRAGLFVRLPKKKCEMDNTGGGASVGVKRSSG